MPATRSRAVGVARRFTTRRHAFVTTTSPTLRVNFVKYLPAPVLMIDLNRSELAAMAAASL